MLTPAFALRQRVLWEKRLGADVSSPRLAAPVEVKCRVNLSCGCEDVKGTILLPARVDALPGDRVTFEGQRYIIKSLRPARTLSGRVNHIEGELA